jgi:uncharacterized protein (DUF2141 family)
MKGHTPALALLTALFLASPAFADEGCEGARTANASRLTVQVNGVRSARGEVAITVYPDDKRRFLSRGGKLARVRVRAASTVRACFWLPPASYEVAVYHDANGNQDFDRTLVGLPAEGFGFSNDPETKIGLPPISAARFRLAAGEGSIAIQMKYLRQAKP